MTDSIPTISPFQVRDWFSSLLRQDFESQRILLIVPNDTHAEHLPLIFDAFFHDVRPLCLALDVLVALGTQPPMSDAQISKLLGIKETERGRLFFQTQFYNHDWERADQLVTLGTLAGSQTVELTHGLLAQDIPVQINSRTRDYDLLLLLCPVYPEHLMGYSGGNACFFPGLAGPEILDAVERMSALLATDESVAVKDTPLRRVADAASAMIPQRRRAITFVTGPGGRLCGLFYDTAEAAWNAAADLSAKCH